MTTYTWTGVNGADWSVAGDWSPAGGPTGIADFAVILGGATVDVAEAESINVLNLAAAAQLLLPRFQFTVAGSIDNSGLIVDGGMLEVAGSAVTLTGGGTLALSGTNDSSGISGAAAGDVLVNASGTITGTGTIGLDGLSLTNEAGGVIDAAPLAAGAGTLTLGESGSAMANGGLMEATTGTLVVQGDVANSGTIAAAGGTVDLSDAVISGGTLTSSGAGDIFIDGGELDGSVVPITIAGTIDAAACAVLGTIINLGSIGPGLLLARISIVTRLTPCWST